MDLIFMPKKRPPFTIEVGYFDTVLEIKEKVEKYQGIPVADQTLVFNAHVLPDDGDIASCVLLHNSRLKLIIASDKKPLLLRIRIPTPIPHSINIEMDMDDTVLKLKQTILGIETSLAAAYRPLVLHLNGQELQDDHTFNELEIAAGSEIVAAIKRPVLRVIVQSKCGTKRVPVEVSSSEKVVELRKECERLNQEEGLPLPPGGRYFFIHKQEVMDDDMSFRWHNVGQDDTIEVFPGRVLN